MRFPAFALLGALIATPVTAQSVIAPKPPAVQSESAAPQASGSSATSRPALQMANDTPAVFSEPTEPVPLLPSQRKLLRTRKV